MPSKSGNPERPIKTLRDLLHEAQVPHLEESLKANGLTLATLHEKYEQLGNWNMCTRRMEFLAHLKKIQGLEEIKDRQALCDVLKLVTKSKRLQPAADEALEDAASEDDAGAHKLHALARADVEGGAQVGADEKP